MSAAAPRGALTDTAGKIVAYDTTSAHGKPPGAVECQSCGTVEAPPAFPVAVDRYLALLRKFMRQHRRCPWPR